MIGYYNNLSNSCTVLREYRTALVENIQPQKAFLDNSDLAAMLYANLIQLTCKLKATGTVPMSVILLCVFWYIIWANLCVTGSVWK